MNRIIVFTIIIIFLSGLAKASAITQKSSNYFTQQVLEKDINKLSKFIDKVADSLTTLLYLIFVTGVVFLILGLLISPFVVVLGLIMIVFSLIFLIKT